LEEYVGSVPDAQMRASEMAIKFEEQVFATSRSKVQQWHHRSPASILLMW
jgi:hypothetical protein